MACKDVKARRNWATRHAKKFLLVWQPLTRTNTKRWSVATGSRTRAVILVTLVITPTAGLNSNRGSKRLFPLSTRSTWMTAAIKMAKSAEAGTSMTNSPKSCSLSNLAKIRDASVAAWTRGIARPIISNCVDLAPEPTIWNQIATLRRDYMPRTSTGRQTPNRVISVEMNSSAHQKSPMVASTRRTAQYLWFKKGHSSQSRKIVNRSRHLVTHLPTKTKWVAKIRVSKHLRWRKEIPKKVRPEIKRKWPISIRQFWQAFKALTCARLSQPSQRSRPRGSQRSASPPELSSKRYSKQTQFLNQLSSLTNWKVLSVWTALNKFVHSSQTTQTRLSFRC